MGKKCDDIVNKRLRKKILKIESFFDADCISYYGQINEDSPVLIDRELRLLKKEGLHNKLVFILTTAGGSGSASERIVHVLRKHYDEVYFIIPNYAYSAGTVLSMSGDEIYMSYLSVLGPIDPQIQSRDERYVSVCGYLDKIDELIQKSKLPQTDENAITSIEFSMLTAFDLGEWGDLERVERYTIDTLKQNLINYKFKNWTTRESSQTSVTDEYKRDRAEEIATKLSNNEWNLHGKPLNIPMLDELGLKIKDYSLDEEVLNKINNYYHLLEDIIRENIDSPYDIFIHTRRVKL
jgi:Periplasmic serine proteases (ClpP class)